MEHTSEACRSKALACERRSRAATVPALKQEWAELAMQWHLMANLVAKAHGKVPQIDFA